MNPAPSIETERLILRGHRVADFGAYLALVSDPRVMRFITGAGLPREQAWARLLRYAGTWALFGYGMWAIEEKASGRFVGEAGFLASKRDMQPTTEGTLETGWLIAAEVQGRGYASEAVGAAVAWAERNVAGMRMTCIIDPDNAASLRVAAKFGFAERARATYQNAALILFERPVAAVSPGS